MNEVVETEKLRQIVSKIETIEQERLESADLGLNYRSGANAN